MCDVISKIEIISHDRNVYQKSTSFLAASRTEMVIKTVKLTLTQYAGDLNISFTVNLPAKYFSITLFF